MSTLTISTEQQEFERTCQEEKRFHDLYVQQTEELRSLNEQMPRTHRQWQSKLEHRAALLKRFPQLKGQL